MRFYYHVKVILILLTTYYLGGVMSYSHPWIPYYDPIECLPNGVVAMPTSISNTHFNYSNFLAIQQNLDSRILCLALAHTYQVHAFTYEEGLCTVYGPGKGWDSDHINIFFSRPHLIPPEAFEEIAHGKPTYTSSYYGAHHPNRVNDGVYEGSYVDTMYSSASGDPQPWWMVDLGEMRMIHQVQILPRQACCPERFHDVEVRVGSVLRTDGDFSTYTLMSTYKGPYGDLEGVVICSHLNGVFGRYLVIQKLVNVKFLHLVEAYVFAKKL